MYKCKSLLGSTMKTDRNSVNEWAKHTHTHTHTHIHTQSKITWEGVSKDKNKRDPLIKLPPPYFRARQIVYVTCHTYVNIFLCTPKMYRVYAFVYAVPHCPSLLEFIICFSWKIFYMIEVEKSLRLPCIKLNIIDTYLT